MKTQCVVYTAKRNVFERNTHASDRMLLQDRDIYDFRNLFGYNLAKIRLWVIVFASESRILICLVKDLFIVTRSLFIRRVTSDTCLAIIESVSSIDQVLLKSIPDDDVVLA